ncbi:MAG: gamma-glutamylcyclotransferase family protein [Candidatus Hydrogenedentales bacterium]
MQRLPDSDKHVDLYLFAYGTLLDPSVQQLVVGRRILGEADHLAGYRLTTVRDGDETFPNVTPDPAGTVSGRVLTVDVDELNRVDRYEGSPYRRVETTLASGLRAWVYIAP